MTAGGSPGRPGAPGGPLGPRGPRLLIVTRVAPSGQCPFAVAATITLRAGRMHALTEFVESDEAAIAAQAPPAITAAPADATTTDLPRTFMPRIMPRAPLSRKLIIPTARDGPLRSRVCGP